ncbi:hypothetical protein ACMFMG_008364 [Clarireedia jacksonii]
MPTSPAPGVVIHNGMNQLANLGTSSNSGSTYDLKIIQQFPVLEEVSPSSSSSSYTIKTGLDVPMPNNTYLVGLAKVNNRGQVAPVASIAPYINMEVKITPKMKFLVSESQQVAGEIGGATIDFSDGEGSGKFFARVVHGQDGRFTVTYYDNFHE